MNSIERSLAEAAVTLLGARVERRDYSSGAWRVVTADGMQIATKAAYPGHVEGDPLPPIDAPVCANTKRDAEALLASLRAGIARRLAEVTSGPGTIPGRQHSSPS